MRYIIYFLLFAINSFACENPIPYSEAVKSVALQPGAGKLTCRDLPKEQCLCFDSLPGNIEFKWEYVDLIGIDGLAAFKLNSVKKAAYDLNKSNNAQEEVNRKNRLIELKQKIKNRNITNLELLEYLEKKFKLEN